MYIACFERDNTYAKNFEALKLGRCFNAWRTAVNPDAIITNKRRDEVDVKVQSADEEEEQESREEEVAEKPQKEKYVQEKSMDREFDDTEIPEYEELERELNGMADMFRKIFLGGKVFSAVRIISRRNKMNLDK